jgi:GntR family transcriptional repressor for pyruvate dehydrogenase complex
MANLKSKAEEISTLLRTEILRGQYRAGERLPSERDLSARFEANRGCIREAIKKLEQLGIVSVTPGGVRILPVEEATLDILGHLLELGEIQRPELMGQTMDVLGAVMSLSVRSAVTVASPQQITELCAIIDNLINTSDAATDSNAPEESWMAFGEALMGIHQNLVLRLVGNGLRTQFLSKVTDQGVKPNLDPNELRAELCALRDAVHDTNANSAADAIIRHFAIIKAAVLNIEDTVASDETRRTHHA